MHRKTALNETQKTIGQDFGMHPAETCIRISANQAFSERDAIWRLEFGHEKKLFLQSQVSGSRGWQWLLSTGVSIAGDNLVMKADLVRKTIVQRQMAETLEGVVSFLL